MIDMAQADRTVRRVSRRTAAPDAQTARMRYILRDKKPAGADFAMLRIYQGGAKHGDREVFVRNLTMQECQDLIAFPLGAQTDNFGQQYVFSHVHQSCL